MPRLRPRTHFSAAFVVIAACGGGGGAGEVIDADLNISENPPAVDAYLDACTVVDDLVGCAECFVRSRPGRTGVPCQTDVCTADPSCCDVSWDHRCVALADQLCGDARCAESLAFGGDDQVTLGARGDRGFTTQRWPVAGGPVQAIAWTDIDGDRDADVAVAGECDLHVLRNDGWSAGVLRHAAVFSASLQPDCASLPVEQRWRGRRARWGNLDADGDLDVVFAGAGGVVVVQGGVGGFTLGETIVPGARGEVTDVVLVDVDNNWHLDAVVSIVGVGTRLFRHDSAGWTEDVTWTGPEASSLEVCDVAGDSARELVLGGDALAVYELGATSVGAQVITPVAGAGALVACLTRPGDKDLIVTAAPGAAPLQIFDGTGALRWSSSVDLSPPVTMDARGIAVGQLDGAVDHVVVADGGADAGFHVFRAATLPAFTYALQPDLLAGNDTTAASLVTLEPPPP